MAENKTLEELKHYPYPVPPPDHPYYRNGSWYPNRSRGNLSHGDHHDNEYTTLFGYYVRRDRLPEYYAAIIGGIMTALTLTAIVMCLWVKCKDRIIDRYRYIRFR